MQHNRDGEQKSYRLLGLFSLLFFALFSTSASASFENFKRQQSQSFTQYKSSSDAAFKNYLLSEWREYKSLGAKELYEKPKPKHIDPSTSQKVKSVGPLIKIKLPEDEDNRSIPTVPQIIDKESKRDINFDFFGAEMAFDIDSRLKDAKYYPYSQTGVANFFESAASSDYEGLVSALNSRSRDLALNDWGVYLLVSALAQNIYESPNEIKLLSWFLLSKLGYDVKIALASSEVLLLQRSQKTIYAAPRFKLQNKEYYLLDGYTRGSKKYKRVRTYEQDFAGATKALDLKLTSLPKFPDESATKQLNFKQNTKEYPVEFTYNKNLMAFMATYPQAEYEVFFNAPMQEETYAEIAQQMKKYLDGKQASDALNFLLHFVQNAFVYERDDEQFGREKVMFAQETLIYDKSDCEDRAVLYSYLVKELLKIGVVGVKYSDHMATALYVPLKGDSVMIGRKKYIVADPTYINASVGESMPKYKSRIPSSYIVLGKSDL